jgi:hypothetical protein
VRRDKRWHETAFQNRAQVTGRASGVSCSVLLDCGLVREYAAVGLRRAVLVAGSGIRCRGAEACGTRGPVREYVAVGLRLRVLVARSGIRRRRAETFVLVDRVGIDAAVGAEASRPRGRVGIDAAVGAEACDTRGPVRKSAAVGLRFSSSWPVRKRSVKLAGPLPQTNAHAQLRRWRACGAGRAAARPGRVDSAQVRAAPAASVAACC